MLSFYVDNEALFFLFQFFFSHLNHEDQSIKREKEERSMDRVI